MTIADQFGGEVAATIPDTIEGTMNTIDLRTIALRMILGDSPLVIHNPRFLRSRPIHSHR